MPGYRCSAGAPEATSSAYRWSIRIASAQPTSRASVRKNRSSAGQPFMSASKSHRIDTR
jgi:hypothetical protein